MAFYDKWFTKDTKESYTPKIVSGYMPTEEGVAKFTPLVSFQSKTFGGTWYIKGKHYTLRKHNLKLAKCLHKWSKQGKVQVMTASDDPLIKVVETGDQE